MRFKIKIIRDASHEVEKTEAPDVTGAVPMTHRIGHAVKAAPTEHRIVVFLFFASLWAVCYYILHAENTAKGIEVFGLAPFADRFIKAIFGD